MANTTVFLYDPNTATDFEITSEVFHVDIKRGRNRELDEIGPGTARIQCRNLTGNFNPFFLTELAYLLLEDGSYFLLEDGGRLILDAPPGSVGDYGVMSIGRKLTVFDGATCVFTGFTEDFEYEWEHGNIASATIVAQDGLARLARQKFEGDWTTTGNQTTGERINEIFTARPEVDSLWASALLFDDGLSTLRSEVIPHGTNVLNECQRLNRAEQGRFYVSAFGALVFQDRASVGLGTPALTFLDTATGQVAGDIPYSAVGVQFGSELLYNKVSVDIGGTPQTADNTIAQGNYGIRHLVLSNMPNDTTSEASDMASYLVDRYSTPEAVVSSIRVPLHKLSSANRTAVAGLEISDTVSLGFTPTTDFAAISETLVIEGDGYETDMKAAAWMTFQLSAAPDNDFFILDNDSDNLAGASILDNDTDTQANAGILGF